MTYLKITFNTSEIQLERIFRATIGAIMVKSGKVFDGLVVIQPNEFDEFTILWFNLKCKIIIWYLLNFFLNFIKFYIHSG